MLSTKLKFSYALGAFGKDIVYGFIAFHAIFYFQSVVGIAGWYVGVLFFIARAWDAINDPMMGVIVDNTKSKFGKFRLWLLIGTLINSVVILFLFFPPNIPEVWLYIYVSVFYILWGMSYTIMDIPFWSMIPALTNDAKEREQISVILRIATTIGFFFGAGLGILANNLGEWITFSNVTRYDLLGIFTSLNEKDVAQRGFFIAAFIMVILFILTILVTFKNVRERRAVENERVDLKKAFMILSQNDQLLVVIITMLIFNAAINITGGLGMYYFTHNASNDLLLMVFVVLGGIAQIGSMILLPALTKHYARREVLKTAIIIPIIGYMLMFIASYFLDEHILLIMFGGMMTFFGFGIIHVLSTVMFAESVDYGEYKLKSRNESIVFSMQPFIVKFGTAISALIIGIGLTVIGFDKDEITQRALNGISVMMFLIPVIPLILMLLIYLKYYKIDEAMYQKIISDLESRGDVNDSH